MKKILSVLLVLMLMPTLVFARDVKLNEFSYHNGDYEAEVGYAVSETLDGGYVIVTVNDGYDFSLVKYDKTDKIVWEKIYTINGGAFDVDVDKDGNIYVTGFTYGNDTVKYWNGAGFVIKFDKDGKELEDLVIGSTRDEFMLRLLDLEIKEDKIVAVGVYSEDLPKAQAPDNKHYDSFDGERNAFYSAILNTDLEIIHENVLDYDLEDELNGVTFTSDGGYVAVGASRSTNIEGLKVHTSDSYFDVIVKYDKDYKLEWVKGLNADSRLNSDNSCHLPFNFLRGFQDVIETCDGNYTAVGSISRLTTAELPEEQSAREKFEAMLGNGYNSLSIDYEEDREVNYESSAAVIVKFDKKGNIVKEYYENGPLNDYYTDILELGNCDLLVTGMYGHQFSEMPSNLGAKNEILGFDENLCLDGTFDPRLVVFNDKLEETWSKTYEGTYDEILLNVSPAGDNEFVAVGAFNSDSIGNAKFDKSDDNYADGLVIRLKMTYEITMKQTENGKFDAVNQHGVSDIVYHGDVATITTSPEVGYKVDTIKVVDSKGNEVPVTKVDNNKYEYKVTDDTWVTVTFKNVEVVIPPKTGVTTYLLLAVVVSVIGYVSYNVINKKNMFKKM